MAAKQIHEIIRENEILIKHASHLFGRMEQFIKQAGQVALLIDTYGNIIHAVLRLALVAQSKFVVLQE